MHQRADATSGLDYYGARYYVLVAGQFTSADTTLAGGLNRYANGGGNPETATDPSGNRPSVCDTANGYGAGVSDGSGLAVAEANTAGGISAPPPPGKPKGLRGDTS